MTLPIRTLLAALLLAPGLIHPLVAARTTAPQTWLAHPRWDDGLAEVCLYDGRRSVYGEPRDSTLELITVREHFDPERLVKTHPAPGKTVLPVIKFNLTRRTRTGMYEYDQMASVFIHRETADVLKLSSVHSEWCGNSSALYRRLPHTGHLFINSYMDDSGVSERAIAHADTPVFLDGLVPWLRMHLADLRVGRTFDAAASMLAGRPAYAPTTIEVLAVEQERCSVRRRNEPAVRVELALASPDPARGGSRRVETFVFAADELGTLLEWRDDQGDFYRLRKATFIDYWKRNRPGDEELLR